MSQEAASVSAKCVFGFTSRPNCNNCCGDGIFSEDESGHPKEPCIFCMEDAIMAGEINGTIDNITYVNGVVQS